MSSVSALGTTVGPQGRRTATRCPALSNIGDRGVVDPANVVAVELQNICNARLKISERI
jgi:hypothetical protein